MSLPCRSIQSIVLPRPYPHANCSLAPRSTLRNSNSGHRACFFVRTSHRYPELTLADARERHLEARKTLASGIDPLQNNKRSRPP
ncbi:integrase arm-type DNA-binding domain-containing protein [Pseudoduganella sp. CY13W]|uniref:Integrase arm-type DNA-binding domain-containing protein n=1 Tax=Duganella qianjiadongensis TaxID=2692176 RepID=A0ABW9VFP6_9BURK|nr:integrase arm-type DNA-binding domain-containing protein [Duganella qianjiadongensis]